MLAWAAWGVPRLHIDSSTDAFVPRGAEVVRVNRLIEDEFGVSDAIIVGIHATDGTILAPHALSVVADVTARVAAIDTVHRVTSIAEMDHIVATGDGMDVVPLFTGTTPEAIATLSERLDSWPEVYEGALVSADRSLAAIVVLPAPGLDAPRMEELLDNVRGIARGHGGDTIGVSIVGLPVVKSQINRSLLADLTLLVPIVAAVIVLVLFLSFRSVAGVLVPLAGLAVSAASIVGLMAVLQVTVTMATMLVPVLLLIVASAYGIHIMSHFFEEARHHTGRLSVSETNALIRSVVRRNAAPVAMAGATTAAGFLAQLASPLGPFRTFGVLSAVGVVVAQLSALLLIPALLRLAYRRGIDASAMNRRRQRAAGTEPRLFPAVARALAVRKRRLATVAMVTLGALVLALPHIRVGTNMLDFFDPRTDLVRDTRLFAGAMDGSGALTLMIRAPRRSAVLEPRFLTRLESFEQELSQHAAVGAVRSIVPYVRRINSVMNHAAVPYRMERTDDVEFDFFAGEFGTEEEMGPDDGLGAMPPDAEGAVPEPPPDSDDAALEPPPDSESAVPAPSPRAAKPAPGTRSDSPGVDPFDEIPTDPAKYGLDTQEDLLNLVAQFLVVYSGNLSMFLNDAIEPDAVAVSVQLRAVDTASLRDVTARIDDFWAVHLPDGFSYDIGGGDAVSLALTELITRSQIISVAAALAIVWLLVTLMYRSPKAGGCALIPVVVSLVAVFGSMAGLGIEVDVVTSLLAALAVGVGVDYAIHFISAFSRAKRDATGNGLMTAYRTTGRAILVNAASVTLGFSGLIASRFVPISRMGILFTVAMLFAAVSALSVLPAVLLRLGGVDGNKTQEDSNDV